MTRKRYRKPASPEEVARQAAERRQRDADVVELRDSGAIVNTDPVGNILSAYRPDVFQLLASRGHTALSTDCFIAARRLQDDVAQMRREDRDRGVTERVQVARSITPVTDHSLKARDRVHAALGSLGRRDGRMMLGLATESDAIITRWREIVRMETGETHEHAQAARVRGACERLVDWYREADYARPKKRA